MIVVKLYYAENMELKDLLFNFQSNFLKKSHFYIVTTSNAKQTYVFTSILTIVRISPTLINASSR